MYERGTGRDREARPTTQRVAKSTILLLTNLCWSKNIVVVVNLGLHALHASVRLHGTAGLLVEHWDLPSFVGPQYQTSEVPSLHP